MVFTKQFADKRLGEAFGLRAMYALLPVCLFLLLPTYAPAALPDSLSDYLTPGSVTTATNSSITAEDSDNTLILFQLPPGQPAAWKKQGSQYRAEASTISKKISKLRSPVSLDILTRLAETNMVAAHTLVELSKNVDRADRDRQRTLLRLSQIQEDYALTTNRVHVLGRSRSTAQYLSSRRDMLRRMHENLTLEESRHDDFVYVSLFNDFVMQNLRDHQDLREDVEQHLSDISSRLRPEQANATSIIAGDLLDMRKTLLRDTEQACQAYLRILSDEESLNKRIRDVSKEYADYMEQQMLWSQSSGWFSFYDILDSGEGFLWLVSADNWKSFVLDAKGAISENTGKYTLAGIACLLLVMVSAFLRFARSHGGPGSHMAGNLMRGIPAAGIRGAGIPLAVLVPAVLLGNALTVCEFTRAICLAVSAAAETLMLIGLTVELCGRKGLARTEFGWPESACVLIRDSAIVAGLAFVPINVLMTAIEEGPVEFHASTGRMLFVLSMIPITMILVRMLNGQTPLTTVIKQRSHENWIGRHIRLWTSVVIGFPLALLLMSAFGYDFTSYSLAGNLGDTVWLILLLAVINSALHRGAIKARQRMALQKMRRKISDPAPAPETDAEDSLPSLPAGNPEELDDAEIDEQTSSMIGFFTGIAALVGAYLIWADDIPAVMILKNVVLWRYQMGMSNGMPVFDTINLLDLLCSGLILIATSAAIRNLPALFELAVLRHSRLDDGSKHAFRLIAQYVVGALGIWFALKSIGIGWKQFQWLAAAMTLGLSFGLQDIFANFVSGVIILLERPVRVGDVVTVGDITGKVTRIRIRCTTITDWDRLELIVPNKTFLSDKVINWTLSDSVTRLIVKVGIGYGSDANKAEKLLLDVADKCPSVLKEPEPSVLFSNFGNDALEFELRVFVRMSDRIATQSHLRHQINRMFKQEGIEIPFAQRDNHLDTNKGSLAVRLVRDEPPDQ